MQNHRLEYLLEQYIANASTPEETKELFGCIRDLQDDAALKERLRKLWLEVDDDQGLESDTPNVAAPAFEPPPQPVRKIWLQMAAAAVILLFAGAGYFLWSSGSGQAVAVVKKNTAEPVLAPGGDKAVLTLANGEQVILDSITGDGAVAQQGNTKISKLQQGQLAYHVQNDLSEEELYNTITTPRGGQYKIVLCDGSKVWLNAASSLKFPVSLVGAKRQVTLTGEAYFEVAPHKEKPFLISVKGVEVEVLGTHFNVNAYDDEDAIKTTLLEGAVEVTTGAAHKVIRPGQQAQIKVQDRSPGAAIAVQQVDVDAVTAWKDGRFVFKGDNIQAVMRQLGRWYDADITYEENVTHEEFVGVISRSRYDSIADILAMLEKTGTVSFAIQGNSIKVMPYKK